MTSGWKIWTIKKVIKHVDKGLCQYVKLMEEEISPTTSELT